MGCNYQKSDAPGCAGGAFLLCVCLFLGSCGFLIHVDATDPKKVREGDTVRDKLTGREGMVTLAYQYPFDGYLVRWPDGTRSRHDRAELVKIIRKD